MSELKRAQIFHNLQFSGYSGNHDDIWLPSQPVAEALAPPDWPNLHLLQRAYATTQHIDRPWWENNHVRPLLRSTSVGDVIALPDGQRWVVERIGFRPFQPSDRHLLHPLREAQRLLRQLSATDGRSQLHEAEAHLTAYLSAQEPDERVASFEHAEAGLRLPHPDGGYMLIIAADITQRWKAERIQTAVSGAEILQQPNGRLAVVIKEPTS